MIKLPTLLDLYTAAAKSNLALGTTFLHGVRRIRQCQIDQISASSAELDALLSQVESLEDMGAWNALQARMITQQMDRFSSYWRDLQSEMAAMQGELHGHLQGYTANASDELRHQVEHLQAEVGQGTAHLLTPLFEPQSPFAFSAYVPAHADGDDRTPQGEHNGSGYATHGRKPAGKAARSERTA